MCAGNCSLFMGRLVSGIVKQRKCLFIKNRSTEGELTISFWQNNFATMNWTLGTLEVYERYLSLIDLNVSQNSSCGTKVWKFFRTTQKKESLIFGGPKNTQSWSMKLKRFMIFSCASCWMNEIGRILKRNPQGKSKQNHEETGKTPCRIWAKSFQVSSPLFWIAAISVNALTQVALRLGTDTKRTKANKTYNNQQTKARYFLLKSKEVQGFAIGFEFEPRKSSKIQIMLI